jgi:hypothetical protein
MLGLEVGMVEVLGFLEHVLAEHAVVESSSGDGTDMFKTTRCHTLRKLHGVTGAVDIGDLLRFGARLEVVDRRQVKEVIDLPLQLFHVRVGHAKVLFRQVAHYRNDVLVGRTPFCP